MARARRCLAAAGTERVRAVVGDAEHGVPEFAPYDRIIVTAGHGQLRSTRTESARTLVDPATPWAPALVEDGSVAYHALRRLDPGTGVCEFGAYAHGPAGHRLAERMVELIRAWDRGHRYGRPPVIAVHPAGTPDEWIGPGWVIEKRHTRVTVAWP